MGEAAPQFDEDQAPGLEVVPEVQEPTLESLPEAVIRDLKIGLIANNPLYYSPTLSRNIRLAHPEATQVLSLPLTADAYSPFLDQILGNPVLLTLYDKKVALQEKAVNNRKSSAPTTWRHQELDETMDIVVKISLWEMLHGTYDAARDQSHLDWPQIDTAMKRHFTKNH